MSVVVRVINLDRSPERLKSFLAANPGLAVERFPGVDARAGTRESFIASGLISPDNQYQTGSIGVAASHIALWRQCAAGSEAFHIAEDDAIFHAQFASRAARLLEELDDWDVVFWGWNFDWAMEVEWDPAIGPTVLRFDQDTMRDRLGSYRDAQLRPSLVRLNSCAGTCSYSISPRGARRYLDRCLPIGCAMARYVATPGMLWTNTGLDVEMSRHHESLMAFACLPPLVVTPNDKQISTNR